MENEENNEAKEMENEMEVEEDIKEKSPVNLPKEIKKTTHDKIKGRIVIFNAEKSEFAKNLKLTQAGDYVEKK